MGNFSMLEGFTAELFSLSLTHTHTNTCGRLIFAHATLGLLLTADCFCDGVQREYPRRGAESASAQHGLQPKCTLSSTLLRHTEGFGFKGEFSADAMIYPEQR